MACLDILVLMLSFVLRGVGQTGNSDHGRVKRCKRQGAAIAA